MKYKRVNKSVARKMYNMMFPIYLVPCKANIDCVWISPVKISFETSNESQNRFDRDVNSFEYYNCCAELGYYAHYYVLENDYNTMFNGGRSKWC